MLAYTRVKKTRLIGKTVWAYVREWVKKPQRIVYPAQTSAVYRPLGNFVVTLFGTYGIDIPRATDALELVFGKDDISRRVVSAVLTLADSYSVHNDCGDGALPYVALPFRLAFY